MVLSKYIAEAEKFYREALKEFEAGKRERNDARIRDSAEKAWNAIVQATNYLFEREGLPIPASHHERRRGLIELARKNMWFREMGFLDRYMARIGNLHESCFHEGIYDLELLEEEFKKVKSFMEDVKKV